MSVGFKTIGDARRVIRGILRIEQATQTGGHIPSIGSSGGGIAPTVLIASITAKTGTSHAARYSMAADSNPTITVTLGEPLIRRVPTDLDIDNPSVGDKGLIYYDADADAWAIYSVDEVLQVASCAQTSGAGAGTSGVTTASEDGFKGDQLTTLSLTAFTKSVTNGTQTKQSQLIYAFPAGHISIVDLAGFLKAAAPTCTNSVRVSIGTTAASGSGTTLTGNDANIMSQTTLGTLAAGGVSASRGIAVAQVYDGTSSSISAYLNICPSANWNATDTITFSQPSTATHAFKFGWKNLGDI